MQVLCLQLQRARWKLSGSPEKLNGHVSFPLCLDVSPYCCASAEPLLGRPARPASAQQCTAVSEPQHGSCQAPGSQPCNMTCKVMHGRLLEPHCGKQIAKQSCILGTKSRQQPGSSRHCYRLIAVVVHHGNAASGHYSIFRQLDACAQTDVLNHPSYQHSAAGISQWVCASDENVRWADVQEVLACQASILFYEKAKA